MLDFDSAFIEQLLTLETVARQADFLQTAVALTSHSLSQLLDQANQLARQDPGRAHQIATLCLQLAPTITAPNLVPRAHYILAQTHAAKGEFDTALSLIEMAHEGYMAVQENLPALSTNLGRMHVLNQLGRHQDVIEVAQKMLCQLAEYPGDDPEITTLTTRTYNNLGICYRHMGRYEAALAAYDAAEQITTTASVDMLGDIQNNRGGILVHLGRVSEGLSAYEAAAQAHARSGNRWRHAVTLNNIGEAHFLLGNYRRSLQILDKAQGLFATLDALADEQIGLLYRADVYLALNLYPEATAAYQQANTHFQAADMSHYRAQALWGLGAAFTAQNRFAEAEAALSEAAQLFVVADNVPMLCGVLLEQAALQAVRGDPTAALATVQQADALVDGTKWPVEQVYVHLRLADLVLGVDTAVAENHLLAAQKLADQLVLPHLHYRLYQRLGQLRWQQNKLEEAQHWLETAVQAIEQLRHTVAQETMRVSFLHDKLSAYESLLYLHLTAGNIEQAFTVAEQAKSRTLLDLMTGVLPNSAADDAVGTRWQALQADLNVAYNALLSGLSAQEVVVWQQRAQQLEQEIKQLQLQRPPMEMVDHFSYALAASEIQAQLAPNLTLIAYHTLGDEILAFVITSAQVQLVRHLSTQTAVQTWQQKLALQWDRFRAGQAFTQRHQTMLLSSTQRVLAALHQALLAPLLPYLPVGDTAVHPLTIIPHGLLHQIPFAALFDGQHYLLEQFEISYAPSAAVFALCQQQGVLTDYSALVMGVSDPHIPAVIGEVQAIAAQLPTAVTHTDDKATTATFLAQAPQHQLLHLACHGLFRADNPMFSSLKLADGWLTAVDILQLNCDKAIVTLSACESGRGETAVGDELLGLSRAFLGAGAASLVVTLWLVQDDTTASLMTDWYSQLQNGQYCRRASALRAAQLALKTRHAHPYYWAPFILIGQR